MPRKRLTEAEKAQTSLTEDIERSSTLIEGIDGIVGRIENFLHIDNRTACCALRDYAQLLVARHMDLSVAGLDDQMIRLRAELEAQHGKGK